MGDLHRIFFTLQWSHACRARFRLFRLVTRCGKDRSSMLGATASHHCPLRTRVYRGRGVQLGLVSMVSGEWAIRQVSRTHEIESVGGDAPLCVAKAKVELQSSDCPGTPQRPVGSLVPSRSNTASLLLIDLECGETHAAPPPGSRDG
jgi:hypothetical protein